MTAPTAPTAPSKLKAWIALVGGLLSSVVIPLVLQYQTALPPQWQAIIGGVIALLTVLGVYHAPYKPTGTVIVPTSTLPDNQNPWK